MIPDTLPPVFTVGEHGKEYEALVSSCEIPLSQVSGGDVDATYKNWIRVLGKIEEHANLNSFDLNGVKIWLNVFWSSDGQIRHIAFFPKKTSRNIEFERLIPFFNSFIQAYRPELKAEDCFSHFGSASFPAHAEYLLNRK